MQPIVMIIVLDTNALVATARSNLAPLIDLSAYARRCRVSIYLPDVVRREFFAYLDRYTDETLEKLAAVAKRLDRSEAVNKHLAALEKEAKSAKRILTAIVRDLQHRRRIKLVPIRAIHAQRAVSRAAGRVPPCDAKGEEVRDAMVWEAALDLLSRQGGPLILLSSDGAFRNARLAQEIRDQNSELIIFDSINRYLDEVLVKGDAVPADALHQLTDGTQLSTWLAAYVAEDPHGSWEATIDNFVEGGVLDKISGTYTIVSTSELQIGDGIRMHIDAHRSRVHVPFESYVWVRCEAFGWKELGPGEYKDDEMPQDPELGQLLSLLPRRVADGEAEILDVDFHIRGEAVYSIIDGALDGRPRFMHANPVAAGFHGKEMISHSISFSPDEL